MVMSGRSFTSDDYRYGFNGKEQDKEGMGGGASTYDYGFRIYNPDLGKFLSVDPLTKSYPWNSPYAFAENRVIQGIDLDGLEFFEFNAARFKIDYGRVSMRIENFSSVGQTWWDKHKTDSGRDIYGNPTIGLDIRVFEFGLTNSGTGSFEHPSYSPILPAVHQKAIGPGLDTKGRNKMFVYKQAVIAKSTGLPDRRVTTTNKPLGLYGGNKASQGLGVAMLIFDAAYFINEQSTIFGHSEDQSKMYNEGLAINMVLQAVASGLNDGTINSKFDNLKDRSLIAQIMLYGQSPDYSVSPELYKTAADTFNANRDAFEQNMESQNRSNNDWWGWDIEAMPTEIEQPK